MQQLTTIPANVACGSLLTKDKHYIVIQTDETVLVATLAAFDGMFIKIETPRVIVKWGAEQGLGSITKGKSKDTQLFEPYGTMIIPIMNVVSLIEVSDAGWENDVAKYLK